MAAKSTDYTHDKNFVICSHPYRKPARVALLVFLLYDRKLNGYPPSSC